MATQVVGTIIITSMIFRHSARIFQTDPSSRKKTIIIRVITSVNSLHYSTYYIPFCQSGSHEVIGSKGLWLQLVLRRRPVQHMSQIEVLIIITSLFLCCHIFFLRHRRPMQQSHSEQYTKVHCTVYFQNYILLFE